MKTMKIDFSQELSDDQKQVLLQALRAWRDKELYVSNVEGSEDNPPSKYTDTAKIKRDQTYYFTDSTGKLISFSLSNSIVSVNDEKKQQQRYFVLAAKKWLGEGGEAKVKDVPWEIVPPRENGQPLELQSVDLVLKRRSELQSDASIWLGLFQEQEYGALSELLQEGETVAKTSRRRVFSVKLQDDYDKFYLFEPKARGKELAELLGVEGHRPRKLNLLERTQIATQLFAQIDQLRDKSLVHRDIKPENIMVNIDELGVQVKIIDFSGATNSGAETSLDIGTPFYTLNRAPGLVPQLDWDIFALAITCMEVFGADKLSGFISAYNAYNDGNQGSRQLNVELQQLVNQLPALNGKHQSSSVQHEITAVKMAMQAVLRESTAWPRDQGAVTRAYEDMKKAFATLQDKLIVRNLTGLKTHIELLKQELTKTRKTSNTSNQCIPSSSTDDHKDILLEDLNGIFTHIENAIGIQDQAQRSDQYNQICRELLKITIKNTLTFGEALLYRIKNFFTFVPERLQALRLYDTTKSIQAALKKHGATVHYVAKVPDLQKVLAPVATSSGAVAGAAPSPSPSSAPAPVPVGPTAPHK